MRAILVMALFSSTLPVETMADVTTWVGEAQDHRLWSAVRGALKAELQPEDPEKTRPYVAMRFKYIARVAQVERVVLVVIGMRERRPDPPGDDYFQAYSVDLQSGAKTPVTDKGFVRWRFLKWTHFEKGGVSEAVFRFQSCSHCEAVYYLGSFWLDAAKRRWRIREWPDDGMNVHIGSDTEEGWHTMCLYGIRDYTNDCFDDIVTWCRTTNVETRTTTEVIKLYTVSVAGAKKIELVGEPATRMRQELCQQNSGSSLCK